jgi:hypothetical protein
VNKANTKDWTWFNSWTTSLASSSTCFTDWSVVSSDILNKYWSIFSTSISQWVWGICKPSWISDNVFIRWGSFSAWENSWIYNIVLRKDNSTSKLNNVWFRCAR